MTQAVNLAQYANNSPSWRNRIINGAMVIDQRNNGASGTGSFNYTVDRFVYYGASASKFTWQRNAGSVTPPVGFTNYLGFTSSSAYTPATNEVFQCFQPIEGFNVADLAWGTASAAPVTLSFWVRSSLTGTFSGSLLNSGNTRSYPYTYTISAANTWTQISVTIPGDTTGTWLTNNGIGITVNFDLGCSSVNKGTPNTWQAGNFNGATGSVNVVSTNGATWYVTGVQLERGTQATNFEYRDYGRELAMCQRYYWRIVLGDQQAINNAAAFTSTDVSSIVSFPVTMRSAPALVQSTGTNYYTFERNGAQDNFDGFSGTFRATTDAIQIYASSGLSGTAGQAGIIYTINALSSLAFNSEL